MKKYSGPVTVMLTYSKGTDTLLKHYSFIQTEVSVNSWRVLLRAIKKTDVYASESDKHIDTYGKVTNTFVPLNRNSEQLREFLFDNLFTVREFSKVTEVSLENSISLAINSDLCTVIRPCLGYVATYINMCLSAPTFNARQFAAYKRPYSCISDDSHKVWYCYEFEKLECTDITETHEPGTESLMCLFQGCKAPTAKSAPVVIKDIDGNTVEYKYGVTHADQNLILLPPGKYHFSAKPFGVHIKTPFEIREGHKTILTAILNNARPLVEALCH